MSQGRRLRGKTGYVVCTSIYAEAPKSFLGAFIDTFDYLGMKFGGVGHANCSDGYVRSKHEVDVAAFVQLVRKANAQLSRA